ncbi:hypothetical protein [Paraburkholderia sp. HP33-1]|uniref:hypothetical protein n=1 Tax=Paraburkholderia sp. HP33-1 TaxID=2883243 RepID=UPI001F2D24E5|nr:hypothetical protein [Paraburkholderia sp. HP33-1]
MKPNEKQVFLKMLSRTFRTVRQPLPDPEVLGVWWGKLEPYPLEMVASALSRHLDVSDFAPTPAAILKYLPKRRQDHLEADEAWALASVAVDENETVIWTDQIAEAWSNAKPLFDGRGNVAARMAFKAAYVRIIERAVATDQPVIWRISFGADPDRRRQALEQAERDGRLTAEQARDALPPPDATRNGWPLLASSGKNCGLNGIGAGYLAQVMEFLGMAASAKGSAAAKKSQKAQTQRKQLAAKKRAIDEKVQKYEKGKGDSESE